MDRTFKEVRPAVLYCPQDHKFYRLEPATYEELESLLVDSIESKKPTVSPDNFTQHQAQTCRMMNALRGKQGIVNFGED